MTQFMYPDGHELEGIDEDASTRCVPEREDDDRVHYGLNGCTRRNRIPFSQQLNRREDEH